MRRAIIAIVVLVLVGAGTFGLGYLSGSQAAPRPRAARSASPTTVLVPKVLHLALTGAVQQVLDSELSIGKVETRTGGEPGTIEAQFPPPGTSSPSGSEVNLFVSTSLYPKGAFEQCPVVAGTVPLGPGSVHEAEQAALRFARAFLLGDWRTVRGLLDPSTLPLKKDHWTVAGKPDRATVLGPGTSGGTPVAFGCGPKVARRTVAVVLDDGTTSASADFNLYLVRRTNIGRSGLRTEPGESTANPDRRVVQRRLSLEHVVREPVQLSQLLDQFHSDLAVADGPVQGACPLVR